MPPMEWIWLAALVIFAILEAATRTLVSLWFIGGSLTAMIAGVLDKVADMTAFLNPVEESYERLGKHKAPRYISWSSENRSQLIRVPAAAGEYNAR